MGLFDFIFGKEKEEVKASPAPLDIKPAPVPVPEPVGVTPAPKDDLSKYEIKSYWGEAPKDVDKPAWNLVQISPTGIKVRYQEKYGNLVETECIGLWQNDQEYMLTWKTPQKVFLQKSNLVTIESSKIEA